MECEIYIYSITVASLCISNIGMFVLVSSSMAIGDYTQQEDSA